MKAIIRDAITSRHLYYRKLKHLYWKIKGSNFVRKTNANNEVKYPHLWVNFECPVVNHPSQSDLLASKVFNMQLACEKLNGLIIEPNAIFSFWGIIDEPSKTSGFLSGPTFERGEIVTSYGGGLCQISGLLYNIAICGGFKILERHPHSIDAYGENRYLPLARDATVAWVSKDLCFQNNTSTSLQIIIKASKEKAEAQLLATIPLDRSIEIKQFTKEDSVHEGQSFRHARIVRTISDSTGKIEEDFGWNQYRVYKSN